MGSMERSGRVSVAAALGLCGLVASLGIGARRVEAVAARAVGSPFVYSFGTAGVLEETGKMSDSASPYWWLNSGGRLLIKNGVGMTLQGELPATDKWRTLYATSSPIDTDGGAHPQNLFRLVTRSQWEHVSQSVSFRLTKLNVSASPERNAWSGILLFNRYVDGNNLYYVGLRHDGNGVIKKKRFGAYYTLAQKRVYTAEAVYERDTTPNLLPGKRWIGLKSVIKTNPDNSVTIQLWLDRQLTGHWTLALQAIDTTAGTDGAPILGPGYAGVRTDFTDVEFDNYRAERLY